jgi:hypothetical protein
MLNFDARERAKLVFVTLFSFTPRHFFASVVQKCGSCLEDLTIISRAHIRGAYLFCKTRLFWLRAAHSIENTRSLSLEPPESGIDPFGSQSVPFTITLTPIFDVPIVGRRRKGNRCRCIVGLWVEFLINRRIVRNCGAAC